MAISSRLSIRLLGLVLAGVVLSFSVLAFLIIERERTLLVKFNREKSFHLASSITKNLAAAMLEKNPSVVKRMLSNENTTGDIKAAVFRNDGSLVYGEIDYVMPPEMITSPEEAFLESKGNLIFLKPLLNEKVCHGCHNPLDRIRGIVAVSIPTKEVTRELDKIGKSIAVFVLVVAVFSGLGLVFVLRKTVLNPLTALKAGAEKIRDGDLSHRIDMERKDELGALATSFNQMAGKIESAQKGLEEAVHKKTKELRIIAELSTNVFRGDLGLKSIMSRFLTPITEELGYSCCALFLVDKETGAIYPEYTKGLAEGFFTHGISIVGDHPFGSIILEGRPMVRKSEDLGIPMLPDTLAIIPLTAHLKKRCRDINQCPHLQCPAYDHSDERCWLIRDTLCRSLYSVRDKHKIYGCLYCETFPIAGILIAGSEGPIGKSSLHSLEILASEVESAIENYRLIDDKRQDLQNLIRLHDTSLENIKSLHLAELTESIVSVAASFANADASLLWLVKDSGTLLLQNASLADTRAVPSAISVKKSFAGRALVENRLIETINMAEVVCLKDLIETHGFLYAASVPLKVKHAPIGCLTLFKKNDFFMTDSEKAIITLFAGQAASAIITSKIHGELKDQKEFSDAIFNSAVSGVMVLDKKGTILRINHAGVDIFQLIPRHVNVCRITDLYPETGAMLHLSGKNTRKEVAITLKDGRTRTIGFSNSPLLDKNGEEKGIIVVFQDLTELKRAEEALREREERLRQAIRVSQSGIFDHDHLTDTIYWSPRQREIYGSGADETVTLQTFLDRVYPEDRERIEVAVRRAHDPAGVGLFDVEHRIIRRDGAIRWLTTRSQTLFDGEGGARRKVRTIGAVLDITERKLMEKEKERLIGELQNLVDRVSRSKREWLETFDSITDVIFLSDLDFTITRVNRAAEKMLGMPLKQILGRKCHELFHGTALSPESCSGCRSIKEGKVTTVEMQEPNVNKFLDIRVIPRFNGSGQLIGLIHVIRNITEQKKLENQLRHAQEMEVVGQLAAGVAHEVRNPLHSLMSVTEALYHELKENPAYDAYLSHINKQVGRLSSLMKDLLDLGKPLQPSNLLRELLPEICAAAVELWKHSPSSQGHKVEILQPPEHGNIFVMADSQRFQQIFLNLLDNAAQHSPKNSEIRVIIHEPAEKMVEVHIVDQGSGIPEEILPRVFEPFFSTRKEGTGLGLSIVRNIIESHRGTLVITNNALLPGCTAGVRLPLAEELS